MTTKIPEKTFAVGERYRNFYAGGDIAWSRDGKLMYCLNPSEVTVVEVSTGQLQRSYGLNVKSEESKPHTDGIEELDEDQIYTFALAPQGNHLLTAHRSGLLRLWSVETQKVVKLWKAQHKGPVVRVQFSPCGTLVCSSGADSTLRLWDFNNSHCLCVLKDFSGPATLVQFHPNAEVKKVYIAGADNAIYCWNYEEKNLLLHLRGHLSQVTGFCFESESKDCEFLATVSRDRVLIIWKLSDGSQHKVVPIYEELQGVFFHHPEGLESKAKHLLMATTKGSLRKYNLQSSKISILLDAAGNQEVKYLLNCPEAKQLAIVTVEQNIVIYDILEKGKLECRKQLIGFNDEILDLCLFGEDDRFLAAATNSNDFKVYDTTAQMNCKIVSGHKDTVLTLAAAGPSNLLLSAGKDHSILLWQVDPVTFELECLVRHENGHTSAIGSIAFGFGDCERFASVCQDGSLKVWELLKDKSKKLSFNLKYSALSHEKGVNCVTYSPNNKIIGTASQDKTAKLWSSDRQVAIGTLRGHTRGVWSIRFSPVDQIVLTSSGDCTLRIWSLASLSCLKRLDQEGSVLRAEFIDSGKYIVSAASDGLLKLWNVKTNACVQTLDEHADRIWSLAVSAKSRKYFYSGAADSKVIKWQDVTDETRNEEIDKRQALLQEEQTLQSLLQRQGAEQKAFALALNLNKPRVSYKILSQYVRDRDLPAIQRCIEQLNTHQRDCLIEHVKAWSTNSRYCKVANVILQEILTDVLADHEKRVPSMRKVVECIMPYTQRSFNRLTELRRDVAFLEFMVQSM